MTVQPPATPTSTPGERKVPMTQEAINHQIEVEAEAARRIAIVKANKSFMAGVYRAMQDPSPPIPWKDLKRK